MIKRINGKKECVVPGDKEDTINFCVEHFYSIYKKSLEEKGFFSVALSGGSTPKAIFQKLSTPPYSKKIDWTKVLVFWSDERAVLPTDSESNYKMAMDAGLKTLLTPHNTFRMEAEDDIEKNAWNYEKLLHEKLKAPLFDLVMLGMGDDGHTASLFPNTKGLEVENRLVVANYIPQKNTWRMTLTLDCINQSQNICFYVLGKDKREMVEKILVQGKDYPAAHVGTHQHKALWILDKEAAANLA